MVNEAACLDKLIDEMSTQLVCNQGEGEAKWKTQALSEWSRSTSNLQEIPRQVLPGGCSQEELNWFKLEWRMYVRYYDKQTGLSTVVEMSLYGVGARKRAPSRN